MQNNLHASTSYNFSNIHHMYSNSHASATTQIHMPMNNMMSFVIQFEHMLELLIACNKVFHHFIHWQLFHSI